MWLGVDIALSLISLGSIIAFIVVIARSNKAEIRYVDTSGVLGVTGRQYAEVWRGKTINFQVDKKHVITVPHVTVPRGLDFIQKTASAFTEMNRLNALEPKTDIERKQIDVAILHVYKVAISAVYYLTKDFAKLGYRSALKKRAMNDFAWFMDVIEQINDYWLLLERKKKLLMAGETLRQTDGVSSTWNGLTLDRQGNRLIKPRFVSL